MDLKIVEKLFLLLVRSQLLQWKRIEALNLAVSSEDRVEDFKMQSELQKQVLYLEDRIKA